MPRRQLPQIGSYFLDWPDPTKEDNWNVVDYASNVLAENVSLDKALELVRDWESGSSNPYLSTELTGLLGDLKHG